MPIESYCQSTYPCLDSSDVAKINRAFNKSAYCDSIIPKYEETICLKDSVIFEQRFTIDNYRSVVTLKNNIIKNERKAKRRNKFYLLIGIVAGLLISF